MQSKIIPPPGPPPLSNISCEQAKLEGEILPPCPSSSSTSPQLSRTPSLCRVQTIELATSLREDFTTTEKGLKVPTCTFKTLLGHYAKQTQAFVQHSVLILRHFQLGLLTGFLHDCEIFAKVRFELQYRSGNPCTERRRQLSHLHVIVHYTKLGR